MKSILHWLPVALCLAFLLTLAYMQRDRALKGENDFVQLYTGAQLAGTPDLYSRTANLAAIHATLGFTMESVVYTRPPFYAALLKPLALLPYPLAYGVFSLASLASILWFVIRFAKECPSLPFFAAMSIPALSALCGGQDTPLLLAVLGASILSERKGRDFAAGLMLSLVAIKFHLFLLLPALLVLKRRWRILGGAASGTLTLTVLGILICGLESVPAYIHVLRDPWINFDAARMPNLHGLVAILHGNTTVEFLLIAVVAVVFVWTANRATTFEYLLALGFVCGLLISFHSGIADTIILLPAFVLVIRASMSAPLRAGAALILTPIPYLMVLGGAPYSAALPALMFLLAITFLVTARSSPLVSDSAKELVPSGGVLGRFHALR